MIAVFRLSDNVGDGDITRTLRGLCAKFPRVGVLDRGLFVSDLSGMARLLGAPRDVARHIVEACAQRGIECAAGIASKPFVARVAATRAGVGQVLVAPTDERAFLAPFSLTTLPLDAAVIEELALLGLRDVRSFAALEPGAVLDRFGRAVAVAHALARAEEHTAVHGIPPPKRIRARRLWDSPVLSTEQLVFALRVVVDEVAGVLASEGLAALRLVLRAEREGGAPLLLSRSLLPPTASPAALLRSLRWVLDEWRDPGQLIGASLEVLEVEPLRGRQLGLFAADGAHQEEALAVAQHLRTRLGTGTVLRTRLADAGARLPEREAEWTEVVS